MSKSEHIRTLAKEGRSVAEIARELGISYQFAYNVCRKASLVQNRREDRAKVGSPRKPELSVTRLCAGGFSLAGNLTLSESGISLPSIPKVAGVYAYVWDGKAHYLGVATRSLAQRLSGYCRPGPTQRTNQRMNGLLRDKLNAGVVIELYLATPTDLSWNGFPISGPIGLEAGLIASFDLPLNIRGV